MNWEAVGATAELFAAFGVLFSLVYLGLQIKQNTTWLRQQAFQMSTNEIRRWTGRIADSDEAAALWIKGQSRFDDLTQIELTRFSMIVFEQLSIYTTYQLHDGSDMLGLHDSAEKNIGSWIRDGWFLKWWPKWRVQFPPEFRVYIEGLIERAHSDGDT
ncbi:MAG: hypothetical protein ACI80L_001164 [Pseudohongiellaceae bacterium]|jgi:hypothetical protein